MAKIFYHKVLIILFGHLWGVELTYGYIFAFKLTLRSQQPYIVPIICQLAAGVVDTYGKLSPVSLTPAANLPPILLTSVANLPRVSLIPVEDYHLPYMYCMHVILTGEG
jgi:hypothetical protein